MFLLIINIFQKKENKSMFELVAFIILQNHDNKNSFKNKYRFKI